jgi:hypothetical protein
MKQKTVFYLREPEGAPYQIKSSDPSEHLILWSIRMYDHILIMPELTILVQEFYCFN